MSKASARVGVLVVAGVCCAAGAASAETPGYVRVVDDAARIQRWFRAPVTEVLLEVGPGTTLEVLAQENNWYWVIVPPDAYGTRRAGWIRARSVEAISAAEARASRTASGSGSPLVAIVQQPANTTAAPGIAEDKVTITEIRSGEGAGSGAAASSTYAFEDVLFDRDRYALGSEDVAHLGAVLAALEADPSLVVNIEGYTCNLGSAEYNLALGARRAKAVKDYLVSQGVAADRLLTASLGEDRPKHDNSREETRQLNRRVSLVPAGQR